jgi:hypothetical protein
MPGKAYISLSPEVLNIDTVWSALNWLHHFASLKQPSETDEQLKARLLKSSQVTIFEAGYESGHDFGPVITVEGTRDGKRQSLEIVVPWNKVLAVVRNKAGEFKPGFTPESS